MGQALKLLNFDEQKSNNLDSSENSKIDLAISNYGLSISTPIKIAAIFIAISGVFSLIFEVHEYFQFRYEIYLARLIPTIFSFIVLILLQSKFGIKNQIVLAHLFLFFSFASLGFVSYKIPSIYLFNLTFGSIFLLGVSIFLTWKIINQVFITIYYLSAYLIPLVMNNIFDYFDQNNWLLYFSIFFISVLSFIYNFINLKRNHNGKQNNYKIVQDSESRSNSGDSNLKLYKDFFEQFLIPQFRLTLEGKIILSNQAFVEVFGFSKEELSSLNFFNDLIFKKNVREHLQKKLEIKGRVDNYNLYMVNKNGNDAYYSIDCRKVVDTENNIFIEGSVKDISIISQREKGLIKELSSLKDQKLLIKSDSTGNISNDYSNNLIANMSHELRTPMNSVLGFLTLIEKGLFESEEELRDFSKRAKSSADVLLNTLNNIIDISKIESGKVLSEKNEFSVNDTIEETLTRIYKSNELSKIKINYSIREDVPKFIVSDSQKYSDILFNIIIYLMKNSEITNINIDLDLNKKDEKNFLETIINNNGEAIPQEVIPYIFTPFFVLDNSVSDKIGRGLELIISKELVELMNGNISADSDSGSGTKIKFSIPLDEIEENYKTTQDLDEDKEEFIEESDILENKEIDKIDFKKRPKLLLVEDNPLSQKVEKKLLEGAGYYVKAIDNGKQAIEEIKTNTFDLVLMDIEMSDMNGFEATKQIRSIPSEVSQIPIIAVTAHSSMQDRERCLNAGMNDYISKPININFLKMTIDQWLKRAEVI